VSGHLAQAYVFPGDERLFSINTQLKKGMYSVFFAKNSPEPTVFTHPDLSELRTYPLAYKTKTCEALLAPCKDLSCSSQAFMSVSPYGHWILAVSKFELSDAALLEIDEVSSAYL
jgi:hypothetical protein